MVPGLTPEHFADLARPISETLEHATRQVLFAAVRHLNPNVSRQAMTSDPTWADVFAWLDGASPEGPAPADRPPRGSYRSPSTTLRPIGPPDVEALYHASLDPRAAHRWRFRGRTPSYQDFAGILFAPEVLCQFIVVEVSSGRSVGLVAAYGADHTAGHVKVAIQRLPRPVAGEETHGLMIEGFMVFAQYLFDHFNFRKLYMEVPEYNMSLFGGGAEGILRIEGQLEDYYFWGDRHWDLYHLSLTRERWDEVAGLFRGVWPDDHFERAAPAVLRADRFQGLPRD